MLRLLLAVTAAFMASALALETPYTKSRLKRQDETIVSTALITSSSIPITFTTTKLIVIDGQTNNAVTLPAKTITIAIPTCIQTIEPDENGHVPPGTCGALWNYYPSFGGALAFTGLFAALVIAHVCMAVKYKKVRESTGSWESPFQDSVSSADNNLSRHGVGSSLWLLSGKRAPCSSVQ